MINPRRDHLLYLLQTRPKEGKEVSMKGIKDLAEALFYLVAVAFLLGIMGLCAVSAYFIATSP